MASSLAATLANVLHRVRTMEDWQNRSLAMLNKLTLDMEDVVSRMQELEFSHQSALREINGVLQRFGDQMAISRRNEQEKARLAFMRLREEMEEEKDACRVLKMQNKQLTKDLTDAKIAAADACEELDRERKARELLEEVCNELAREIGEDKAEVEQLKQEQAESRRRLEEELRMMRVTAERWRGERSENALLNKREMEMDSYGKLQAGKPLRELRSKLEAFMGTIGVTCTGPQEDIERKAEQVKLLRQALELLELEEARERENHSKDMVGSAVPIATGTRRTNSCFIAEKVAARMEVGDGGDHNEGDRSTGDGGQLLPHDRMLYNSRKPRKARRRLRTSAQQRQHFGRWRSQLEACGQADGKAWKTHCTDLNWSSSDGELDRKQPAMVPSPMQGPHAGEQAISDKRMQERANGNSESSRSHSLLLETSGVARHMIEMMRPVLSELRIKQQPLQQYPEQSACHGIGEGSQHKHSLSARFEVEAAGMEHEQLDRKLKNGTGSGTVQYSFSEDDAASHRGRSRMERRRRQEGIILREHSAMRSSDQTVQKEEGSCSFIRNGEPAHQEDDQYVGREDHSRPDERNNTARCEAGSDSDDFYFEPVREPGSSFTAMVERHSHKLANENETGTRYGAGQQETDASNCGDQACCRIMARASSLGCREVKEKVRDSIAESSRSPASQEVVSTIEAAMNKMSPWRSTSTKHLQRFWPPSPDAFSIFGGGAKKLRSKAGPSACSVGVDTEQPLHGISGASLHSLTQRHPSPAAEEVISYQEAASSHRQHLICMKGNSLGAQLIKAREHDKPTRPSFRISPLRRAISHG